MTKKDLQKAYAKYCELPNRALHDVYTKYSTDKAEIEALILLQMAKDGGRNYTVVHYCTHWFTAGYMVGNTFHYCTPRRHYTLEATDL